MTKNIFGDIANERHSDARTDAIRRVVLLLIILSY